jgi:polyphosphate kinase
MQLIGKLHEAALAGVEIKMIIRGICCMLTENNKFKIPIQAISIVDEYLEHARVLIFHNGGNEKVYISSADWMIRNLDHRIEVAVHIKDKNLAEELKHILEIQLGDNVQARILDNKQLNHYVNSRNKAKIRSQEAIYQYLIKQQAKS